MKKRLLTLTLVLALSLGLTPAWATEGDYPPGVDRGEYLTMAFVDGTVFQAKAGDGQFFWQGYTPAKMGSAAFLNWWVPEYDLEWSEKVDGTKATIVYQGATYHGTVIRWMPTTNVVLGFHPVEGTDTVALEQFARSVAVTPALSADVGPYHFQTVYTGEYYDDYDVYLMDQSDAWTGVRLAYMKEGLAGEGGEALPSELTAWRADNGAVMLSLSSPFGQEFTTSLPVSSLDWCLENLRQPMPEPTVTATAGGVTLGMVKTRYYNLFYFRDENLFLRNDGNGWKRLTDVPFTPSSRLLIDEIGTFVVSDETAGVLYVSDDGLDWTRVDALRPTDLETVGLYTTYKYSLAKTDTGYLAARHIYERSHGMMSSQGGNWYEGSQKVYFLDKDFQLTGSHDFGRLVEKAGYENGVYSAQVSNSTGTRYNWDNAFDENAGSTWYYSADGENWTTEKPEGTTLPVETPAPQEPESPQPTEPGPAGALEGVAAKFPNIKEYPGFADVDEGDWFYPYVKMCYETGLLVGTGEGNFSPKAKLTQAEAITLAARIHQILNGGDGVMPQAPADWAKITLTFADGVSRTFDRGYPGWGVGGRTFSSLYFNAEGGAFAGLDGQHVSITFEGGGPTFLGKVSVNSSQDHMGFTFLEDEDLPEETRPKWQDYYAALMTQVSHTDPKLWWAGTTYYLQTQGIGLYPTEDIACRADFVNDLDTVAHDLLDPINHIEDIPDDGYTVPVETVLDFYNAGILTGVDDYGTFAGVLGLTRAEMAAMAARLVRPELRIAFTPAEPEYRKYTLTELLSGHQDDNSHYLSADLFSFYRHDEEGNWAGEVFLRADGSILELPDGAHFQQYPNEFFDTHLVVLAKPDYTVSLYVDVTGVMDTETGEMVLPFDRWHDIVLTDNDQFLTRKTGEVTEPWVLRDRAGKPVKELWGTADWQNYHEGLAIKWDQDSGRFGFVNADDQWVIPPAYGNSLGIFRGGYCVTYSYDPEGYVVIDKTGKIVLGPYGDLPGLGLDDRGGGLFRWSNFGQREGAWVSPGGTEVSNQYLFSDIYLRNGYFALVHSYLDRDFRYATPNIFDWTGPIGPDGSGFVGIGDKVYRIQFVND